MRLTKVSPPIASLADKASKQLFRGCIIVLAALAGGFGIALRTLAVFPVLVPFFSVGRILGLGPRGSYQPVVLALQELAPGRTNT
jgi:hypothetical protein